MEKKKKRRYNVDTRGKMTLTQERASYKILRDIKMGITESNYIGMKTDNC
jgi:hypothetical protein